MNATRQREVRFPSAEASLVGVLAEPDGPARGRAVFCHPYPPMGGSMDNNVVYAAGDALVGEGLACLRFNFRGVGDSQGVFNDGPSAVDDVLAALDHLDAAGFSNAGALIAGGYSFGAAVAAGAAAKRPGLNGLILVSPPSEMFEFPPPEALAAPLLVLAGDADPYCDVEKWSRRLASHPAAEIVVTAGVDHFWAGDEDRLGQAIGAFARRIAEGREA